MSLLEPSPRSGSRLTLATLLVLLLCGCFRPLYGPTATGEPLRNVLASIEIDPVATGQTKERVGHYLRSELIYELDGSGEPSPKRYKLTLVMTDGIQTPIVDSVTGRAISAIYVPTVSYTLKDFSGKVVTTGVATFPTSYDRSTQRFATVRAARDAEIRAAKELAQQIKTRLVAALLNPS
jgi:LPS-assembly lipoprotein